MINIRDVFKWYNYLYPPESTHLARSSSVDALNKVFNSPVDDEKVRQLETDIEHVLIENLCADDPLCRCEALVKIGMLKYEGHQAAEASVLFEKAAGSLTDPGYAVRLAAVQWMLGMAQFSIKDYHKAYENWKKARGLFSRLAEVTPANFQAERREWFAGQLHLMNLDLARIPEEALEWASDPMFGELHINGVAAKLNIATIYGHINARRYNLAYDLLKVLPIVRQNSHDPVEKGGLELVCGIQYNLMNYQEKALELLHTALTDFPERSHQRAVTLWIIGTIDWQVGRDLTHAADSWQHAVERFKELRKKKADHDRNPHQSLKWYDERLVLMEEILNKKLDDHYPF